MAHIEAGEDLYLLNNCSDMQFLDEPECNPMPFNVVPLKLTGPFGHHYVTEGAPFAEFRYNVLTGNHLPYFLTWKLNGSVFNGNTRISLFNDSKTLVLRFPSRVDSGIYTLTANSTAGSTSLNLIL